ncbi:MAG: YdcF family protein [Rubrobacter sp.]|nr:YdcF family protein [Rubrobacter sp.]
MKHRRNVILLVSGALMLLVLLWVSYTVLQIESVGRRDDARPADAIVVLGTGQEQGWPSPAFRARLDHALSLYEEGIAPLVVVAGGNPEEDSYTEAEAGVRYLEYYGLPSEVLVGVGGDNTYQNLQQVEALAKREGWENVVLVSERFHMFRSLAMAQELGLPAHGSPTSTSPAEHNLVWHFYFELREVAAYTAYTLGIHSPTHF